jgi:hypothetical protein
MQVLLRMVIVGLLLAALGAIGPGGCTKQKETPQDPEFTIPDVPPSERDSRKRPAEKK